MNVPSNPDPDVIRITHAIQQRGYKAYLVGGYLRDLVMDRKSRDVDFAVGGDAPALAAVVAEETNGHSFLIDRKRGVARVVFGSDNYLDTADFANMQGASIEEDLGKRDFSVDAMAVDAGLKQDIIDPHGGLEDIGEKRIRAVSDRVMADDPVRLVRAFRLAVVLGFTISEETLAMIGRDAHFISSTPGERIRNELVSILKESHSAPALQKMADVRLLKHIFPGFKNVRDLKNLESSVTNKNRFGEILEYGINRLVILKMAVLLGDADKETAVAAADRLRLSRKSKRALLAAIKYLDIL
jgi:poly(A) polymerase